ncbi:MAG: sialidase family protein [Planctomycetales bacterium]
MNFTPIKTSLCQILTVLTLILVMGSAGLRAEEITVEKNVKHVVVYHEDGRFGGWPANHGIWTWGNEILTGFSRGLYKDLGPDRHAIDREKPEEHWLARSLDGGETWKWEDPSKQGALIPAGPALHGIQPPWLKEKEWEDCPGGINFTDPNFVMTLRMTNMHHGPSRFYYSYDRGHNWKGPFRVPNMGTAGIAARTDYIVEGPSSCLFFLTAGKADGEEGRPLCARTTDGGKTWNLQGWIAPEQAGYAIMPSTERIGKEGLLTMIRYRDPRGSWIDAYRSPDNGKTWRFVNQPVTDTGEGNPASLIRLKDGRLCLSYGFRKDPFGVRVKLSSDEGNSWSKAYILRADGHSRDVGYPVSMQRPDGKVVVIYYYCQEHKLERDIIATIWDPPAK